VCHYVSNAVNLAENTLFEFDQSGSHVEVQNGLALSKGRETCVCGLQSQLGVGDVMNDVAHYRLSREEHIICLRQPILSVTYQT